MLNQEIHGNGAEGIFMGGREDDRTCISGESGLLPARGTEAPAISFGKTRKAILWGRCNQIIAMRTAELEKLGGDATTDSVNTKVVGACIAMTVTVKASTRRVTAQLDRAA